MKDRNSSLLFAEKSIGKLLARFALPAVLAQIANSIYLIVDQVLLANSNVGTIGHGATAVAFPILTAANAFAFLFGGGGAAFASLALGKGDAAAGRSALRYSLLATGTLSLLIMGLGFLFLKPILLFFGATEDLLPYALTYSRILLLGIPIIALGGALSYWVRADGSPGFSMGIMLAGAGLNIALDWVFLFPLQWGIAGLALAMVLSRGVTVALGIWYLRRRSKHFSLTFGLDGWQTLGKVIALGSSGFLMQCAILIVQIVTNRSLGTSVAIGAMGVVTKVNGILIAIVTGLAVGAQPILGFHQGAGNHRQVRKTYSLTVIWATAVAILCWCVSVFASSWVAQIFAGGESGAFVSTAAWFMRVYLLAIFTVGFQLVTSYYFQATGRPWRACFLTVSRQLVLLVPLILILPSFFGVAGVLYAGPVADLGASLLAGVFIWREKLQFRFS